MPAKARPASDWIEDADTRYDDRKSGRVKPLDGEQAFNKLREKSKEHCGIRRPIGT